MSDIAIKLENISKFYKLYNEPKDRLKEALHPLKKKYHRKFFALRNINLEVRKGEILGIVGRNGSGKSTLLKLISGVIQPGSGKVIVKGAVSALLELGAGLNPEFTGIRNIYFSGTMMGFTREEMKEKVDDIVAFADIGDFIHQPMKTYSSGMKARLGFALAINMEPEILVLDEVLAVGDELFKRKCYAKMEELFKSGCTVLFVSHSANSINETCSRAIMLDNGELILNGPPKMVTMYYQKLLFARKEHTLKLRDEIIQLNKDEEKKKRFAANLEKNENKPAEKEKTQIDEKGQESKQESFFIPDFKPKSTVITKNYDVDIYDGQILTLDGKKVNALVLNEEYIYSYKVKFNIDMESINFWMSIFNEKGLVLSRSCYPGVQDFINDKFYKGSKYEIKCYFKCKLLRGTYYVTVAIKWNRNGEIIILNWIRDYSVFKVQKAEVLNKTAIFDFDQEFEITKID
ncbi:MAG: ABC transporter ATP-binding protein [Candidatus Aminicenantes bacterium]|nr:MAG: ABC transporter ATP-binding protein [Candidatus Aminicenantes bacterium]